MNQPAMPKSGDPRRRFSARLPRLLMLVLLLATPAVELAAKNPDVRVRGYGFFGNRQLHRALELLDEGEAPREHLDSVYLENAIVVLSSYLRREGFLEPEVTANLVLEDGTSVSYTWVGDEFGVVPREIRATRAEFRINRGVFYYFHEIEFEGLESLSEDEAVHFFITPGFLFITREGRAYTPSLLDRGVMNLQEALMRRGHENAAVSVASVLRDDETGQVDVAIRVREGPVSLVRSVATSMVPSTMPEPEEEILRAAGERYSNLWLQDFIQAVRNHYYRLGYPDVRADLLRLDREPLGEDQVLLDVIVRVEPGNLVHLGEVRFAGNERTVERILHRRVRLPEGDPLNRLEVEEARYRLATLGVFRSVRLQYERVNPELRNTIFHLDEGKQLEASLLLGYGSYELLRGGFELQQFNLWGRAHITRAQAVQSFRGTSGEYSYTVPELFGEFIDGSARVFGLRREEVSFTRTEWGSNFGLQRHLRFLGANTSLRYTFGAVEIREHEGIDDLPPPRSTTNVASVILELSRDRRDNPIFPRSGYRLAGNAEVASRVIGGQVDYQRLELGGSAHWMWREGRWIHAGLSHGLVLAYGDREENIPLNRLFFPGGENSVRGYQQGEAAPRARGVLMGATSYVVANLDFEQALAPNWSAVVFLDLGAGTAQIEDYPFDQWVGSAGLGVRYRTIIGPARLEYGYNIRRREADPRGALHFSLGIPF